MKYTVIRMDIPNAGKAYAADFKTAELDLANRTVLASFNTRKECNEFCRNYGFQAI